MIEIMGGFGMFCIVVLQGANLYQSRRLTAKIDSMVSASTCAERRNACDSSLRSEIIHQKREMRIIERKMDHHSHNGCGVKYQPVSVE